MAEKSIEIIKKGYIKEYFTDAQIEELAKCKMDPIYFIQNYILIQNPMKGRVPFELYPFQEKLITGFASYRNNIALTGRQMGKCLSINTLIKLKSPTGEIIEVKIGDFYAWCEFKEDYEKLSKL